MAWKITITYCQHIFLWVEICLLVFFFVFCFFVLFILYINICLEMASIERKLETVLMGGYLLISVRVQGRTDKPGVY